MKLVTVSNHNETREDSLWSGCDINDLYSVLILLRRHVSHRHTAVVRLLLAAKACVLQPTGGTLVVTHE